MTPGERRLREQVIFAQAEQQHLVLRNMTVGPEITAGIMLGCAFHLISTGHPLVLANMFWIAGDKAADGMPLSLDLGAFMGKGEGE